MKRMQTPLSLISILFLLVSCEEDRAVSGDDDDDADGGGDSSTDTDTDTDSDTGLDGGPDSGGTDTDTGTGSDTGSDTSLASFSGDVLPIFQARCVTCHGSSGGLSLSSRSALISGGVSGAAVVPGDAAGSLLVKRIEGTIAPQMPLSLLPLDFPQIQTIRSWIDNGAINN